MEIDKCIPGEINHSFPIADSFTSNYLCLKHALTFLMRLIEWEKIKGGPHA